MSAFPETSATLIAKIRDLGPEKDAAEWVRFWNTYSLALRQFAVLKGGEANADDIVMQVLAKLVTVLRSGQYVPEKGKFHSYLATMIVNEVRMAHRKAVARADDWKVSLDAPIADGGGAGPTYAETLAAPDETPEWLDEDWRKAVLKSAEEHVLTRTALSARDRAVYREYAQEGRDIAAVAGKYGLSRNAVSQIKTRIEKRIVQFGRRMLHAGSGGFN